MIAANHPALGMNPHQSGDTLSPIFGPGVRAIPLQPFRAPSTPMQSSGSSAAAARAQSTGSAPNVISPAPQPLPSASSSTLEVLPASVPASASATGTDATSAPGASFSLTDWLTEETLWPGYPNGLIAAGGVIVLAWLFGGKKRR